MRFLVVAGCGSQRQQRSAFTLVQILIALGIIGILVGLSFTMFQGAQNFVDGIVAQAEKAAGIKGKTAASVKITTPADFPVIPNRYLVVLNRGENAAARAAQIAARTGGTILHTYGSGNFRGFALQVPDAIAPTIARDPGVAYINQDRVVRAAAQTTPTGIGRINAHLSSTLSGNGSMSPLLSSSPFDPRLRPQNLNRNRTVSVPTTGTAVAVAVIDSGITLNHPDLYVELDKGFGFPDGSDRHGHGTHVAGIIGALDNNIGVVGVAPGCRLWALKALDGPLGGSATGTLADVIAAVNFVTANAGYVKVCNMSLGGGFSQAVNDAVEACVAAGVVVVVAAGNSALNASGFSPASAPNVITVAALADSDGLPGAKGGATSAGNDDTFATFSNYGAGVDVIAPGVDILSTYPGNSYTVLSGTSMASPYVAGLVALMLDPNSPLARAGPIANLRYNSSLTPAQVRALILNRVQGTIPGRFDAIQYPLVDARSF